MPVKKSFFWVVLLLGVTVTAVANEPNANTFKRSGRVFGSAFTGVDISSVDGETSKAFVLDRMELGYIYNFSENWLFKGCFDISDPKDGGNLKYTAFARNAFGEYHNDKLVLRFGMITGISFNFIENRWGHRYIAKCYQEYFDYSASRDAGVTASYKINKGITIDGIISNGEGYKQKQADNAFEYGLGATVTPFKGGVIRAYADLTESELANESTYAIMMGYDFKNGSSLGAEYNAQQNAGVTPGNNQSGCSVYTTVTLNKLAHLYARYDFNDREDTWDYGDNAQVFFVGLEFNPTKGVKITPNYIHTTHSAEAFSNTNEYRISCELRF